jgi:hypothetical protein
LTAIFAVLAAEAGPPGINDLAKYGPLGVFSLALLWFAWWVIRTDRASAQQFAEQCWKRETERADRLEAEVTRLNGFIQEKAIPAMLASATAVSEATEMVREDRRGRRRRDGDDA